MGCLCFVLCALCLVTRAARDELALAKHEEAKSLGTPTENQPQYQPCQIYNLAATLHLPVGLHEEVCDCLTLLVPATQRSHDKEVVGAFALAH